MAIFAQIASLQGAGTFFDYRQPSGDFPQNGYFRPNRQSQRGRDVFRHYRQPSCDFRQNCQFRQNGKSLRGHEWHPIQIVRGWRFFAIFAIACISGHKWKWRDILMVRFYYRLLQYIEKSILKEF